jgi:hypothetical protein
LFISFSVIVTNPSVYHSRRLIAMAPTQTASSSHENVLSRLLQPKAADVTSDTVLDTQMIDELDQAFGKDDSPHEDPSPQDDEHKRGDDADQIPSSQPRSQKDEDQSNSEVVSITLGAADDLGSVFRCVKPTCIKCGTECDPFRSQIKTKRSESTVARWICNTCNTRLASLSRSFGRWPTPEFQELSESEQMSFWKTIAMPGVSLKHMKSMLLEQIVKSRTDKVEASIHGSWLPLSVYAAKGYNVDDIKKNCTGDNVKEHPMLGTTYRVPISSLNRYTTESRIRESLLKSWADVSRPGRAAASATAALEAAPEEDPEEEEEKPEVLIFLICACL